ncbi:MULTISPECIES: site-specific integrase [unclassified Novosphingobium]|uniref:site-specific integrase n=1 Tax=unclassified Novosphingobium TaxID=2644732 RepID=UPI00146ADA42|nr:MULTISPECIES: site-specific integrase [unclassified Novosphingobium]NMN06703.1 integrase [Novosphingobium sp. SG919]NMN88846.1 integrase [Novosphingobium sp. SG916]
MANLCLPLTDTICAQARVETREYALRDTRQPGLSLRVQPCGARSWIMRTRKNGRAVRHSLGTFPETPVKAARQIAAALIAADVAPPPAPSASPLFEIFQAEHETRCGAFYKPRGLHTYRGYVRRQLLPAFAGKRLDAITRQDIVRWFEGYTATSPGAANRALGILGHILGRAKAWGYMPDGWRNPVTGIRMNRRNVVGTFLSEDQMGRLGTLLAARMTEGCQASALLHFLTLTGCRVSEAINLEWRDVLPDRLRLRDSKTGPRDVPLGRAVRHFFKARRASLSKSARTPPSLVFALADRQGYEAVRKVWLQIRKQVGLPPTLRIHDLRHSFASHAVMSGETLFLTSRLLGHSRIQMTARYAHLADAALLTTAEKIGELITRRCGLSSTRA